MGEKVAFHLLVDDKVEEEEASLPVLLPLLLPDFLPGGRREGAGGIKYQESEMAFLLLIRRILFLFLTSFTIPYSTGSISALQGYSGNFSFNSGGNKEKQQ